MIEHRDKQFARPRSIRAFLAHSRGKDDLGIKPIVMGFWQYAPVGIMPFGMGDNPPGFSAKIAGDQGECARAKLLVSSVSRSSGYDDNDVICRAVRKIAESLTAQGGLAYEILPEMGGNLYRLSYFTTQRLIRVPGWYIQLVPHKDRSRNGSSAFVFLRSRNVWEISMPPALGGVHGHARLLRRLGWHEFAGPKFFHQGMEKQKPPEYFDFGEYIRAESVRVWSVTNKWGWMRGDTSRCTAFYSIHRSIRHEWALAVLREHIIRELNALLMRLGIHAKIAVEGLSSPEEILAISEKMIKGEMTFIQALESAKKQKPLPI